LSDLDIVAVGDGGSLLAPTLTHTGLDLDIVAIVIELAISLEAFLDKGCIPFTAGSSCTDTDCDERHNWVMNEEIWIIREWLFIRVLFYQLLFFE
jgi:hypothetical protein